MSLIPTVLLVEDSEDDAFFFQRTLKKGSIQCHFTHVSDGGAAIRLLTDARSHPDKLPGLIFLDLKMPVKNGFEVLEWLRQQEFSKSMEVIVLSGSDQEADKKRASALGAAGYLVKPVSSEVIKGLIYPAKGSDPSRASTN
jgi:CheY-like chemotaxis protein